MKKAIFLDRDGVIIKEVNYLHKKEDIEILPGAIEALHKLKQQEYLLIVITNQPTIAKGLISKQGVKEIHDYLNNKLQNLIDRYYFCPHHPNADLEQYRINCNCRKPKSGMMLQAAKDFNIDLKNSWMIGDRISDIIAGNLAGCKTILIKRDYSYQRIQGDYSKNKTPPDFKVRSLKECLQIIRLSKSLYTANF